MSKDVDRLYELLPLVHRQRDAKQGWPLKALLRVIAEQVNVVEADIDGLYANWFVETCDDWVVPYIGDLVGYRPVHEAGEPGDVSTAKQRALNKILVPRREVANTIHYRRRKGTLALFELLARQVAGWPARAVEFYRLLDGTQAVNHLHPERARTVDLRKGDALDLLDGPFDILAHTVDVRRIGSHHRAGRHNIPCIGVYVWRLKSYQVSHRVPQTQAYCLERSSAQRYTFSVLGNDMPLYTRPVPADERAGIPEEMHFPVPIRRRAFEQHKELYYGPGKSLQIWTGRPPQLIPPEAIVVADLSDWERYLPHTGQVAVDPELGRILFPGRVPSREKVWVSYYYGFSADIGGGEYERPSYDDPQSTRYQVGQDQELHLISDAVERWQTDKPQRAIIELLDSGVYSEQINIELDANQSLAIRAKPTIAATVDAETEAYTRSPSKAPISLAPRPIVRQLDYQPSLPDTFTVTGKEGSSFTLDGVLLTGRPLLVQGPLREVTLRHVTLVPGWELHPDGEPDQAAEYSLQLVDNPGLAVKIEHSILGSIEVNQNEVTADPVEITISDSILDATSPDLEAIDAPKWPIAHAVLTILRSTVIGRVYAHAIELAENSIFDGTVLVGRSQHGCMRFCYVRPDPKRHTPRRFRCQPDLVERAIQGRYQQDEITLDEQAYLLERERLRVRPQFSSARYGSPTYARLADTCAEEIRRGADDEAEMGVFHDLYQPQAEANLLARLAEYAPAGTDIGIIYAS